MANDVVKKIGITGVPNDVRDIGAEAQNIEVSYDANNDVIVDIHEAGIVVDHVKPLTEALLNVNVIQYREVPEASAENEDKIIEYIGETSQNYINGYFYKCIENELGLYSWENIDVQPEGVTQEYVDNALKRTLGSTGKNLFNISDEVKTDKGVTFISQSGVINVNGTNSDSSSGAWGTFKVGRLPKGVYKFTGLNPSVSDITQIEFNSVDSTYGNVSIFLNELEKEIVIIDDSKEYRIAVRVKESATVNNKKVYPMLRPVSIKSNEYESYYSGALSEEANNVLGAKNLLKNTKIVTSDKGITFTKNSDGSITLSGTNTEGSDAFFDFVPLTERFNNLNMNLKVGKSYKLTGSIPSVCHLCLRAYDSNDTQYILADDTNGNGAVGYIDQDYPKIWVTLQVYKDISPTNTVYPMLCPASVRDDTYVPYAMTNKELTENKQELIQYQVMPSFSDKFKNKIIEYIGVTTGSYTNGYFYKCDEVVGALLPYNFYRSSAIVFNNEIHILGSGASGNETKHYKWNGSNWISVSTLPFNFRDGAVVILNNEIHILGGSDSTTSHYKYNGSTWISVSTLPYDFHFGSAVIYNNEIHILGGEVSGNETSHYTSHYKYNGSTWTSVSTLPYSFYEGSAVVYNNEIHILGSFDYTENHYKWNGSSWTSASTLPYSFFDSAAIVLNDEIHILGSNGPSKNHYKWNGSSWTSVSTLPYQFIWGAAVIYNNEIHILGGYAGLTNHYVWNNTEWIPLMENSYTWEQINVQPSIAADPFTGATSSTAGTTGLVPAPAIGEQNKLLQGDGTWNDNLIINTLTIGNRDDNFAIGVHSSAEGINNIASGRVSHAEGENTEASGSNSHTEGEHTIANASYTHAEGYGTLASYDYQHVQGKYNDNKSTSAFEIGNGTADNDRSNIFELTWNGDLIVAKEIIDGYGNVLSDIATIEDINEILGIENN